MANDLTRPKRHFNAVLDNSDLRWAFSAASKWICLLALAEIGHRMAEIGQDN
jgi:hypothetical protein